MLAPEPGTRPLPVRPPADRLDFIVSPVRSRVRKLTSATPSLKDRYAEQGAPGAGDGRVAEVFERIEAPADRPDMGRVVPEFDPPSTRELVHPPFRIVCRRDRDGVRIVRICAASVCCARRHATMDKRASNAMLQCEN